jgi:hypothetical protein
MTTNLSAAYIGEQQGCDIIFFALPAYSLGYTHENVVNSDTKKRHHK